MQGGVKSITNLLVQTVVIMAITIIILICSFRMWPNIPLKERIINSACEKYSSCIPLERPTNKYKRYDCDKLQGALHAIASKELSVRHAATIYGIPKSTLWDHSSGHIMGSRSGPPGYLTLEEESILEKFLVGCAKVGFLRSRQDVMCNCERQDW